MISPPFHPRGHANRWDDDIWLGWLLIDDDSIDIATSSWERHVGPAYRGIIDGDGWEFDVSTQQYVRRNGKVLDDLDLKWLMLLYSGAIANEMEEQAESMVRGDVLIEDWQDEAAASVKDLYLNAGAVAAGGFNRLMRDDLSYIIGSPTEGRSLPGAAGVKTSGNPPGGLADAFTRLYDFANGVDLKSDRANSSPVVIRRAGMYALPAHTIFEEIRRNSFTRMRDVTGKQIDWQELNVLDDTAEHCRTDEYTEGCEDISEAGWAPIGTYPAPGLRSCGPRCRCHMVYRVTPPNELKDATDADVQKLVA